MPTAAATASLQAGKQAADRLPVGSSGQRAVIHSTLLGCKKPCSNPQWLTQVSQQVAVSKPVTCSGGAPVQTRNWQAAVLKNLHSDQL